MEKILLEKVDFLTEENSEQKHRLSKYEHPKNSNNSSVPPSKDEHRPKRHNLREKISKITAASLITQSPVTEWITSLIYQKSIVVKF